MGLATGKNQYPKKKFLNYFPLIAKFHKNPQVLEAWTFFWAPVFTWKTFSKNAQAKWMQKWFLEKVECLISLSLWRNLSTVLEILSRKLRNDDQVSSMWQQPKSKQTAAWCHAPLPQFFWPNLKCIQTAFSRAMTTSPSFVFPSSSLVALFCIFLLWPRPFFEKKIGPSPPRLLLLIIGSINNCLNSRCDLSKHNQRPWETEYLC